MEMGTPKKLRQCCFGYDQDQIKRDTFLNQFDIFQNFIFTFFTQKTVK